MLSEWLLGVWGRLTFLLPRHKQREILNGFHRKKILFVSGSVFRSHRLSRICQTWTNHHLWVMGGLRQHASVSRAAQDLAWTRRETGTTQYTQDCSGENKTQRRKQGTNQVWFPWRILSLSDFIFKVLTISGVITMESCRTQHACQGSSKERAHAHKSISILNIHVWKGAGHPFPGAHQLSLRDWDWSNHLLNHSASTEPDAVTVHRASHSCGDLLQNMPSVLLQTSIFLKTWIG